MVADNITLLYSGSKADILTRINNDVTVPRIEKQLLNVDKGFEFSLPIKFHKLVA